jgi:uncharacterized membrane protein YsdA (DUF1294 family)/cold shock CspA family protein
MRIKGKIINWNDEQGYGFIQPAAGGEQIFLHISAFRNRNRYPEINEKVTFEKSMDGQGRLEATNALFAGDVFRQGIKSLKGWLQIFLSAYFLLVVSYLFWAGYIPILIFSLYWFASFLALIIYAKDKHAAQNGTWRTSENTLHLLALIGGWPGANIAQQTFRHKSRKRSFRFVFWWTVLFNCSAFVWILTPQGKAMIQPYLNWLDFKALNDLEIMLRQVQFGNLYNSLQNIL